MTTPAPTPATAPATTPAIIAWTATADDQSAQFYVWVSAIVSTRIETLRAATLSTDPAELRQQAIALQQLLPSVRLGRLLRTLCGQYKILRGSSSRRELNLGLG